MLKWFLSCHPKLGRCRVVIMSCAVLILSVSGCQSPVESSGEPSIMILELSPKVAAVDPGDTLRFSVSIKNGDGAVKPLGPSSGVIWTSSASEIAVVDEDGLVRSMAPGEVQITAAYPSVSDASASLTVKPSPPSNGMLPAFPGAEGWGATALNESRDLPLKIHFVTSRAKEGPGTLLEAVNNTSSDHYDVIMFRTGGVFETPDDGIRLNSSHVYIAGQTAPGDGVAIDGDGWHVIWFRGYGENITDIVMRYMRIRGAGTPIRISKGSRIVIDHMSLSRTDQYLFALSRYASDWSHPISEVSVQNSLFAEALAVHPTGFVLGGPKDQAVIGMSNISIHRNLLAHNSHRNPSSAADNTMIANNVIYNWNLGAGRMTRRGAQDWVNNFGKRGPMTRPDHMYIVNPSCTDTQWLTQPSIYAAGNVGPMSEDPDGDNWTGSTRQVACFYTTGDYPGQEVPEAWRRNQPHEWQDTPFPIRLQSAIEAYERVLTDVGVNRRLACDGTWVSGQDEFDRRVISETRAGTGPSRPPSSRGSMPSYSEGTPCDDTDGDGLPDAWEERFFGCPTCADPSAKGREGFLLVEHYVNGTKPN